MEKTVHTCDTINDLINAGIEYGKAVQRLEDAQDAVAHYRDELQARVNEMTALVPCNEAPVGAIN